MFITESNSHSSKIFFLVANSRFTAALDEIGKLKFQKQLFKSTVEKTVVGQFLRRPLF